MNNKEKKTAIIKTFLTEEQRAAFKALCAGPKNNTTMQAALEDYIIDCLNQKELL
jgi:hypothetical protein